MILGQNLERLISKLNADGGGGGGGGGGVPAGASGVASGDPTSGGFGGTVAGGGLGGLGGEGFGGGGGIPAGASPVASGDPTSAGFGGTVVGGSVGEGGMGVSAAAALGTEVGEAVASGNMTADEGNQALAGIGENSGFMGQAAANTSAALASIPSTLSHGFSAISPVPLAGLVALGGSLAALTGQGMLGAEPEGNVEGGGGDPNLKNEVPASTVTQILKDLDIQGDNMADSTQDIIKDLEEALGGDSGRLSFKIGNQTVSILPKAQRDELKLLLDFLNLQQQESQFSRSLAQTGSQFGQSMSFQQQQAEPSFVDKSAQLLGLGSDAVGLWKGISSIF